MLIATCCRPLNVCVPDIWDKELGEYIGAVTNDRYRRNLDHNSGNPIGLAVCQCSGHEDRRSTANGSFLANPPQNLTILTDTCVEKVLFEGKTAIGVEALGRQSQQTLSSKLHCNASIADFGQSMPSER